MPSCLTCPPTVEGGRSRAGVGRGRLAPRGSAPPCRAPRPNDACTAEGGFLPPRARPRAGGRVFAPSPTLLGPFAPQRVAAAHRGDVAEGFEASCCLPLAMTVRACTSTCDCTATVAPTAVGEHEMGSKGSAAKAGGRLEPPSTLAPCCAGSTATVGSRVCDFACSTDAGVRVELTTSLTRPVPTSDAERPLALAVKEPASSRGRPLPLPWSCAVEGHPSALLSRSVRMCCLSNSYSRTDKRPRSSSSTTRSSFTNGSSVSLAALPSWAALRRGRPSLYGAAKSCCCPGMFRFPVSGSGRFFPPQLGISWQGGRRLTLQERAPCDCVPQSLSRGASTAAAAVLERKGGYPTVQNSPARLPDVGLGPRVGLPGRQKPVGYGTSWSVLVSGTSGRSGSSEPNLFSPFPSTNLVRMLVCKTCNADPPLSD